MPYVIDRERALWTTEIIAVVQGERRRIRSRVILRDNSLYQTLTRPRTFIRNARGDLPGAQWTRPR